MSLHPHKDAESKDRRRESTRSIYPAKVVANDLSGHSVRCKPLTADTDTSASPSFTARVTVPEHGDINIPDVESLVLVMEDITGSEYVVGSIYGTPSDLREYAPDERHIGTDDEPLFIHGPFGVVPRHDSDPDDPDDGAVWYNETAEEYRGVEGGTKVKFDTTNV